MPKYRKFLYFFSKSLSLAPRFSPRIPAPLTSRLPGEPCILHTPWPCLYLYIYIHMWATQRLRIQWIPLAQAKRTRRTRLQHYPQRQHILIAPSVTRKAQAPALYLTSRAPIVHMVFPRMVCMRVSARVAPVAMGRPVCLQKRQERSV